MSQRFRAGVIVAALATILVAGGCSSTDSASPASGPAFSGSGGGSGGDTGAMAEKDAAPNVPEQQAAGAPPAEPNAAPSKVEPAARQVIRTGTISVRVDDVKAKADEAATIATGNEGLVAGDTRTLDSTRSTAQLVLRVPGKAFDSTMNALAGLGTEENRAVKTDDVTEAALDLDTRIASQQASVNRVRTLMAQAKTIGEVVAVEAELTRRETELATLTQRKTSLADQVAYSTITLSLRGPTAPSTVVPEEDRSGFLGGLKDGWDAFMTFVDGLAKVLGAILPFLIILVPLVFVARWLYKRQQAKAAREYAARAGAVPAAYGLTPPPPPPAP